ncbi:class C sortase [Corynebacterium sp. 13CS0277]|uniref:class C sortase n=1 Tax=Corynebacterium sp. 13CS0277 TaxID=2071994 RepID=UPI000D041BD1|nr:class C sortase [Corynebacterium sp. 13CS0277]PRQ11059.1 class C sortase [Corynebacterium sp. 13CS0277]
MALFQRKHAEPGDASAVAVADNSPAAPAEATPDKGASNFRLYIPIVGVLLGIALLLYPVFATRHNDVVQQQQSNNYSIEVNGIPSETLAEELAAADTYNEDLRQGVILDPFIKDVAPDSEQYQAYLKYLDLTDVMSLVRVPAADVNLPVYHGTFDDTLQKGVGHLFGSSLPVGGDSSHSILTGHTGLPNATMFDNLTKVKEGDAIYLNTANRALKYVVNDIRVVEPSNVDTLGRVEGKDLLTLITCTPYGVNSHRLLITGERVPLDDIEEQAVKQIEEPKAHWSWWMFVLLGGAILSAILMFGAIIRLWLLMRRSNEDKKDAERAPHPENS